jgi:hypothetical protein
MLVFAGGVKAEGRAPWRDFVATRRNTCEQRLNTTGFLPGNKLAG